MWKLSELEPQQNGEKRWSVGNWGPIAYLTCDRETARLIAAAPELLEALKFLADCSTSNSDGDTTKKPSREALRLARSVIAKAEGKEG